MDPTLFLNNTSSGLCSPAIISSLICLLIGTLASVTLCGNLLVIISIVYFKQLQTPTNTLVLSLAVADLLVGAVVLPFSLVIATNSCSQIEYLLCVIRGAFDITLCASSILSLCSISIDRYLAVCQPLRYKNIVTFNVSLIMIVVVWTVSSVCGIVMTVTWKAEGECSIMKGFKTAVIASFLSFCTPVIIMVILYAKIFYVAWKQVKNINCIHVGKGVGKMERKATRTLMIVMGVFIICWTPFVLLITAMPFVEIDEPSIVLGFKWLGWSNSMLNPFIYAVFYSWFRSAFKLILNGKIFKGDFTNAKLV
ncbi:trace amine-associated receptor 4-like [Boleophthalmus pectinirostris]|uniref:trace amine-associated receptor 4-like n=1 Tax=Boleophthalmus pectinirostris TaxID=150288 RepID=UPI00242B326D|nr:trace amine-associated receptor 4-like [Boleophthalmus pectinirostris]